MSEDVAKKSRAWKDVKKRKKPAVITVPIAMDGEFADEYNAAYNALTEAKEAAVDEPRNKTLQAAVASAQEAVDALLPEVEDQIVEFQFRSIGRRKFEDLVDACPATKAQKTEAIKKGQEEPGWNLETFPPTLIAAAIVSPEMDEEDAFEMWDSDDWNQAELVQLFLAALSVNQQRKVVELGKEFGLTDS